MTLVFLLLSTDVIFSLKVKIQDESTKSNFSHATIYQKRIFFMDKEQHGLSEQPFTETTQANEFDHKGLLYPRYTWETDHWLISY